MKISIRVKPGSKQEGIEKTDELNWIVKIRAQPVDGKANEGLIRFLAEHLQIPKSRIAILKGHTAKTKLVEIEL